MRNNMRDEDKTLFDCWLSDVERAV
jgi:hypothetical protein